MYKIALMLEGTGDFEILEHFDAPDDDAANDYATDRFPNVEWYVLDSDGNNING